VTEPSCLSTTRVAYDAVAEEYARLLNAESLGTPLDLAVLAAFADLVRSGDAGPVADLGCGPGRITAHLGSLGLVAFGIDLSPTMVAVARRTYPDLRFDEGSMTALALNDGAVSGVVAWYSIIHTPPELLPVVFAEIHRVLAPGGHLLPAFQVGNELLHIEQAYGRTVSLDAYRLSPDGIAELLHQAGLIVTARVVRQPEAREKVQQARLLAASRSRPSWSGRCQPVKVLPDLGRPAGSRTDHTGAPYRARSARPGPLPVVGTPVRRMSELSCGVLLILRPDAGAGACRHRSRGVAATQGRRSASTAIVTKTIVRYVVDQWNSRIGLAGSSRRIRPYSRWASTAKTPPTDSATTR